MPVGTVGFRVAGEVEREDYDDVLVPELRRALDAGGGLRTLYLIEDLDTAWFDVPLEEIDQARPGLPAIPRPGGSRGTRGCG